MEDMVSVIMPCYNHANYVGDAIESILNQTYKKIELILIDNCSEDGTREIIKEFEKKDSRIVAIYHKKNIGYAGSINEGIKISSGDFIAWTSSDDLWHKDKLDVQIMAVRSHPLYDIFHSDARIIDDAGRFTGKTIKQLYRLNPKDATGNVFLAMRRKNLCCTSTVLFRRKCLQTCSEFDEEFKIAHDWWFYIELAKKHKFYYIPKILAEYRIHSTNLTRNTNMVYRDYLIIHSRLAKGGPEPLEHLIAAAFAAAVIGKKNEMRNAIEAAKKHRPSPAERLKLATIERFAGMPSALLSLNSARQFLLGAFHGFAGE